MTDQEKKEVISKELDSEELEAVSGGSADGSGACYKDYYYENCYSEVKSGSSCWFSGDYCASMIVKNYTQPGGCAANFQSYERTFSYRYGEYCDDNFICRYGGRLSTSSMDAH